MEVPFMDLSRSRIKDDIQVIKDVIESEQFVRGSFLAQFEHVFAEKMGFSYGIGVNSGTDALTIAIIAAMGRGISSATFIAEEIITTPNSFVATAESIISAGYKPVFADIDPDTYLINPESILENITEKTIAIIPVHLYGQSCDMTRIYQIAEEKKLLVIEDACQAHGVNVGADRTKSVASCYSFYPSKNLGAYGDGGAITTNSVELKNWAMAIRDHGATEKNNSTNRGFNSRLDGIQSAILGRKIQHLDEWNEQRRDAASLYNALLVDVDHIDVKQAVRDHVYHLFVIESDKRDELRKFLSDKGVHTGVHYPRLIYQQPFYMVFANNCSNAERVVQRTISLPLFPGIQESEIQYVCDKIKEF